MELAEFNETKLQIVSHTKDITLKIIGWGSVADRVENHAPYESGQIDDHFSNAFDAVLSPTMFARERKPEMQQKEIRLGQHSLTIAVGHMVNGLEDVDGFDLIYYIRNSHGDIQKATVFQHKKRKGNGSLSLTPREKRQKRKIAKLCSVCDLWHPDFESFVRPHCSSLYVIGDRSATLPNVVSTCMLGQYVQRFAKGNARADGDLPLVPDRETIDVMFLACLIGDNGHWNDFDFTRIETMKDAGLANHHIVVEAFLNSVSEARAQ